jgi:hypothetical protein|tara:strand:+ start:540 stop:998 length:459 start_codon:yes stop_codon:yes gene_type:complete
MNNTQNVTIVGHPESGELFTASKKEGFYKCMVQSTTISVNNGMIDEQKVVAFPAVTEAAVKHFSNLKDGDAFPIPGQIVVSEYFDTDESYREGMVAKINPTTQEDHLVDGKRVYRETVFTTDLNRSNSFKYSAEGTVVNETQVSSLSAADLI